LTPELDVRRLGSTRAIITTFDARAVTLTLSAAGPVDDAECDRLQELFRFLDGGRRACRPRRTRKAPPASRSRPGYGPRRA